MKDEEVIKLYEYLFRDREQHVKKYGNHSCQDCAISDRCAIVREDVMGDQKFDEPNSCSYYWHPNCTKPPGAWLFRQIENAVKDFQEHKAANN